MRAFRLLDLTLPTPEENLALDEALLDEVDEQDGAPVLRFWESERLFVVLGASSRRIDDVDVTACEQDEVPVLRRASGGGTVLQGPGCLSYAFVLPLQLHPSLATVRNTNQFVLERVAGALRRWEPTIAFRGISDLAIDEMKVSGNAQRRTRGALLIHGTILHAMPAAVISRYLRHPVRQPEYRRNRAHGLFLRTIDAQPQDIKHAIAEAWPIGSQLDPWPEARMRNRIPDVISRSLTERART